MCCAVSNGRMARIMRKKTWTIIAVANDSRNLWSCLQKATDAHDAMRQCAAEMGAVPCAQFKCFGTKTALLDHTFLRAHESRAANLLRPASPMTSPLPRHAVEHPQTFPRVVCARQHERPIEHGRSYT